MIDPRIIGLLKGQLPIGNLMEEVTELVEAFKGLPLPAQGRVNKNDVVGQADMLLDTGVRLSVNLYRRVTRNMSREALANRNLGMEALEHYPLIYSAASVGVVKPEVLWTEVRRLHIMVLDAGEDVNAFFDQLLEEKNLRELLAQVASRTLREKQAAAIEQLTSDTPSQGVATGIAERFL